MEGSSWICAGLWAHRFAPTAPGKARARDLKIGKDLCFLTWPVLGWISGGADSLSQVEALNSAGGGSGRGRSATTVAQGPVGSNGANTQVVREK